MKNMKNMKNMTKHLGRFATLSAAMLLGIAGLTLTACNTTEGAGRDIEAAGKGIQNAAD